MNRENIWTNSDGLYVGFGTRAVETNSASAVNSNFGNLKSAILKVSGADLAATAGATELANSVILPAGCEIHRVRIVVDSAFTGANALLDVGAYSTADAAVDVDGFCDAITVATLVAGYSADFVTTGGAGFDGDLIKTILAQDTKVAATLGDANAFSAGAATVVIDYSTPAN